MHFGDFGPGHRHWQQHGREGGPRRVRRGNVRAAVLALLSEQPMHGYQMIQEISQRSGGTWSPSPGSIYPTLQMLEDEGLVTSSQSSDGKRLFQLTDAGRQEASLAGGVGTRKPWEEAGHQWGGPPPQDLMMAIIETGRTILAASMAGTEEQRARIVELLTKLRQDLSTIVPDAPGGMPFGGGWPRGPRGRNAGWPFSVPDWVFGGPGRPPWAGGSPWSPGGPTASAHHEPGHEGAVNPGADDDDGDDGTVLI